MTNLGAMLGIPREAIPAWQSLSGVLDRMTDQGRSPVCTQRPDDWSSEAKPAARREAAEACAWCPAVKPCRTYGQHETSGVWGGIDRTARPTTTTRKAAA